MNILVKVVQYRHFVPKHIIPLTQKYGLNEYIMCISMYGVLVGWMRHRLKEVCLKKLTG